MKMYPLWVAAMMGCLGLVAYMAATPEEKAKMIVMKYDVENKVYHMVHSYKETGFPAHVPYGQGIGIYPGRVVWDYNPKSVSWDGEGYWWEENHFHAPLIRQMIDQSVQALTGIDDTKESWQKLFLYHNQREGQDKGYVKGEKIAIKVNLNGTSEFEEDHSGKVQLDYVNPVVLRELLHSMVENGIAADDISVYDVSRVFPDYMVSMCTQGILKGVHFVGRDTAIADYQVPIRWSYDFTENTSYLPTVVTDATYLINLADLKGHCWGISLCGKNHFGSIMNDNYMNPPVGADLHPFMLHKRMDHYMPHVDFMASQYLGRKTILYMLDALLCAPSEESAITKRSASWQQAPFHGGYTSSIFMSEDPVAIDSVGADFLMNEPAIVNVNGAVKGHPEVEGYLHEAALADKAPSGVMYQDGNGNPVPSLGVHEHWNNTEEKRYSRNLSQKEGIELIQLKN